VNAFAEKLHANLLARDVWAVANWVLFNPGKCKAQGPKASSWGWSEVLGYHPFSPDAINSPLCLDNQNTNLPRTCRDMVAICIPFALLTNHWMPLGNAFLVTM